MFNIHSPPPSVICVNFPEISGAYMLAFKLRFGGDFCWSDVIMHKCKKKTGWESLLLLYFLIDQCLFWDHEVLSLNTVKVLLIKKTWKNTLWMGISDNGECKQTDWDQSWAMWLNIPYLPWTHTHTRIQPPKRVWSQTFLLFLFFSLQIFTP